MSCIDGRRRVNYYGVGGAGLYNAWIPSATGPTTTRPPYIGGLVLTEFLGSRNAAQIVDLTTIASFPTWANYENGTLSRTIHSNLISDASGDSDYNVTMSIAGVQTSSVKVKYLTAPSVTEQSNITYAGQSWMKSTNGLPIGDVQVITITCSPACTIPVPASSAALVFWTDLALDDITPS